jgi:hypothetical protein
MKLYEAKTGNHQGLIIEEETGRNVAVTYDKADAPTIVHAVNSYEDLLTIAKRLAIAASGKMHPDWYEGIGQDGVQELEDFLKITRES